MTLAYFETIISSLFSKVTLENEFYLPRDYLEYSDVFL